MFFVMQKSSQPTLLFNKTVEIGYKFKTVLSRLHSE